MSVPYEPATVYFDSFPLLELSATAAWPGNNVIMVSDLYDVADMLPAIHFFGNAGETLLAASGASNAPDPRFFVDWHLWIPNEPSGVPATDAMVIFSIFSGVAFNVNLQEIFKITCHGPAAPVAYGPVGGVQEIIDAPLKGSVRVTGRQLTVQFHTYGNAPANFAFGAYLRPIGG